MLEWAIDESGCRWPRWLRARARRVRCSQWLDGPPTSAVPHGAEGFADEAAPSGGDVPLALAPPVGHARGSASTAARRSRQRADIRRSADFSVAPEGYRRRMRGWSANWIRPAPSIRQTTPGDDPADVGQSFRAIAWTSRMADQQTWRSASAMRSTRGVRRWSDRASSCCSSHSVRARAGDSLVERAGAADRGEYSVEGRSPNLHPLPRVRTSDHTNQFAREVSDAATGLTRRNRAERWCEGVSPLR